MGRVDALLRRGLIHRCVVTPASNTLVDGDGQPIPGWGTPLTAVPCRLVDLDDREIADRRQQGLTAYSDALLFERTLAIQPDARVTAIEGYDRATGTWAAIEAGPFAVVDVKTRYGRATSAYKRALLARAG